MPDANIDEPTLRPFAPHLIAEEFGARADAYGKIEGQRFSGLGRFGIERPIILALQAMEDAGHRLLDDDPKGDLVLLFPNHEEAIA